MKIKSLLIGSAAALTAATGARAADAIFIPEPEPVEYVRVCDAYGSGFFYIPGTETCLRIGGYVWYQIGADNFDGLANESRPFHARGAAAAAVSAGLDGWLKSSRARLDVDARSDTEWGTLRGFIRFQSTWDSANQFAQSFAFPSTTPTGFVPLGGDGNAIVEQAYIQLGGLYMGFADSAWQSTLNGGASNFGSHSWTGMSYGAQRRQQVGYNFGNASSGLFGTVSLEHDGNANYMPDVVAKVGYGDSWGVVWAKVAYDDDVAVSTAFPAYFAAGGVSNQSGVDGWAASVGLQLNVPNAPGSSFRLIGYYADNANAYNVGGKWSVLGSYNHRFTPTLAASVGLQYIRDSASVGSGNPIPAVLPANFADWTGARNTWLGELSVVWTPVTNFEVRTELGYAKDSNLDGSFSGFLRFTRYF